MEVQTRTHDGELKKFESLQDALQDAKDDRNVWKVSFNAEDGDRVRLVRTQCGWTYENIWDMERYI